MDWTAHVVFWHWWVVAAVFVVLEISRPRFVFLWLGFAAAAVGFLLLVFPSTPVRAQLALFGLLAAVSVVAWRRYRRNHPTSSR
jgi:membrane protein implicated in regulation of membrane protease activity